MSLSFVLRHILPANQPETYRQCGYLIAWLHAKTDITDEDLVAEYQLLLDEMKAQAVRFNARRRSQEDVVALVWSGLWVLDDP